MLCQFYSGTFFLYICVYVTVLFVEEEEEEEEEEEKEEGKKVNKGRGQERSRSWTLKKVATFPPEVSQAQTTILVVAVDGKPRRRERFVKGVRISALVWWKVQQR